MTENATGKKLKVLREYAGYSTEKLGKFINASGEEISRWERGESQPSLEQWVMLCRLYCVSPNEMFSHLNADELVSEHVLDEFHSEASINRLLRLCQHT